MKTKKHFLCKALAIFLLLITLFALLVPFSLSAAVPTSESYASHILLYCLSTDTLLYEKNADLPIDPGYTAQMMTALLAIEYDPELNKNATLSPDFSWSFSPDFRAYTDYGFKKGVTIPIKDMLAVMIQENATSAATLLAEVIGGSVDSFVTMMNARAKELGMTSTVFANPTGVSSTNATTTLHDLFILTKLLYEDDRYMDIASSPSYKLKNNNFTVYTRNYLIGKWYTTEKEGYYYAKATGMKTDSAHDKDASRKTKTVIATAREADENDYLVMVLGGDGTHTYQVAKDFFRYGSTDFRSLKVIAREDLVKLMPVNEGDHTDRVPIFPEKDVSAFLPKSTTLEQVTYRYNFSKKELTAPLSYGTKVGEIHALIDGEIVGTCSLIVGQNLAKGKDAQVYGVFGSILLSPIVLIGLAILAVYLLRKYLIYRRRKKKSAK